MQTAGAGTVCASIIARQSAILLVRAASTSASADCHAFILPLGKFASELAHLFHLGRGGHAVALGHAANGDNALVLPLAIRTCGLVHSDRRVIDALAVAVEQKGSLGKRKTRSAEGVQAVDGSLLLRGDVKPVDRRSEDDHVGVFQQLYHAGHVVLLHAGALMGKAVLASQATSNLFAGNADDLDRMAGLTRGLGKRLDHGVGIGALTRAAAQYNDIQKNLPPSRRRRAAHISL